MFQDELNKFKLEGILVNKAQLIDAIAASANLSKADATIALDATLNNIVKGMIEDGSVVLAGHGTYTVKLRAARIGRDPRTGGTLNIPATMVASFKAGKALKDTINAKAVATA